MTGRSEMICVSIDPTSSASAAEFHSCLGVWSSVQRSSSRSIKSSASTTVWNSKPCRVVRVVTRKHAGQIRSDQIRPDQIV